MLTTVSNNKFILSINEQGFYDLYIRDGVEMFIADIELFKDAQRQISGKKLPTLISGGQFSTTNIETMRYIAKKENMPYSGASAYIVGSISQRILGNFYLRISKPERPTRFFNHREEAIAWLSQYL